MPSLAPFDILTYCFESISFKSFGRAFVDDADYGYFFVSVKQGTQECSTIWTRYSILNILVDIGGLLNTLNFAVRLFFSGYLMFKFDMRLMSNLYSEQKAHGMEDID